MTLNKVGGNMEVVCTLLSALAHPVIINLHVSAPQLYIICYYILISYTIYAISIQYMCGDCNAINFGVPFKSEKKEIILIRSCKL